MEVPMVVVVDETGASADTAATADPSPDGDETVARRGLARSRRDRDGIR